MCHPCTITTKMIEKEMWQSAVDRDLQIELCDHCLCQQNSFKQIQDKEEIDYYESHK